MASAARAPASDCLMGCRTVSGRLWRSCPHLASPSPRVAEIRCAARRRGSSRSPQWSGSSRNDPVWGEMLRPYPGRPRERGIFGLAPAVLVDAPPRITWGVLHRPQSPARREHCREHCGEHCKEDRMTVLKMLADAFHEGGWGMWPILLLLMLTVSI